MLSTHTSKSNLMFGTFNDKCYGGLRNVFSSRNWHTVYWRLAQLPSQLGCCNWLRVWNISPLPCLNTQHGKGSQRNTIPSPNLIKGREWSEWVSCKNSFGCLHHLVFDEKSYVIFLVQRQKSYKQRLVVAQLLSGLSYCLWEKMNENQKILGSTPSLGNLKKRLLVQKSSEVH